MELHYHVIIRYLLCWLHLIRSVVVITVLPLPSFSFLPPPLGGAFLLEPDNVLSQPLSECLDLFQLYLEPAEFLNVMQKNDIDGWDDSDDVCYKSLTSRKLNNNITEIFQSSGIMIYRQIWDKEAVLSFELVLLSS